MKKVIILINLLGCLSIFLSCGYFFKKGFPQYSGEALNSGVQQEVKIYRDTYGVPHIYAQNEHDLYFAQGYVHAQDRLWQMETLRRLARGRLSEIIGQEMVEVDFLAHLLGMPQALPKIAQQVSEEAKAAIQAYIQGINAFVEARKDNLPLEFSSLKVIPEPYTESDVSSAIVLNAWFLNRNFLYEVLAVELINRLGAEAFAELFPSYPGAKLPPDSYFNEFKSLKVAPLLPAFEAVRGQVEENNQSAASNNWVVSGSRSQSGKPILANDPHLALTVPSIWYFNHLHSPNLNVTGASMPGAPGVIIGHNGKVAWGLTNVMTDYVDLFIIRVDPECPTHYQVDGKMLEMTQEEVTIPVKDADSVQRVIYHTIHGPIISKVEQGWEAQVALKWHIHEGDQSIDAFLKFNQANSVPEVMQAGRLIGVVSQNLVTADTAGNIGWHVTGKVPIREGYSGRLPADGSRSSFCWKGFIPYDELPSAFNPPEGYIVTANHRKVDDSYPYVISYAWAAPYRAQRITQLLQQKPKLNPDDFRRIQGDYYSLQAEKLVSQMADLNPRDEAAAWALNELRNWDKQVTADSRGALIFEQFLISLTRLLLADEMGKALNNYHDCFFFSYMVFDELLTRPDSPLWDRIDTPARETREQILKESLSDAVNLLTERLGKTRERWQWGQLHQLYYQHPAGTSWLTRRYLNCGPYPIGGDHNTVNIGGFYAGGMDYNMTQIASLRMIVDLADINHGRLMGTMGQSGQPLHPHYNDFIDAWRNVEYFTMFFTEEEVKTNQEALFILKP